MSRTASPSSLAHEPLAHEPLVHEPLPMSPPPAPVAAGPKTTKTRTTTTVAFESVSKVPANDRPPHLESLHLLLFDIRLTALSARLANDRTLQAFLTRLPPPMISALLAEVEIAREQDIAASPRSLLPTEEAADAAFRSARRAFKIEFRLNEMLAAYRREIPAVGEDSNIGSSLPQSTLDLLTSVIQTSDAHRKSHSTALRRALQSWAESDESANFRTNIETLQARLAVLTSDTTCITSPGSSPDSPNSLHQLQSHSADLGPNPFDHPDTKQETKPMFRSHSVSSLGLRAQARAHGDGNDPDVYDSQGARSTASLSAAAGYNPSHPYGAPWPPSPHYYFLPPYGHPHGSFPPLYDSTPLHFPLTDRLLRDTPSRVAGFRHGSSTASKPSLRPHVTPNSAFEAGDIIESPSPKAMAVRPYPENTVSGARPSRALTTTGGGHGRSGQVETVVGPNGQPAQVRKRSSKNSKKVMSKLAHLAQSEGAGMLASAIVENAPVPKNFRRWHSIGRVVNDWYGFDDEGPSKAEMFTKGMGFMLSQTRRRHSFHAGTRGGGHTEDSDSDEGGGLGELASHAIGMMAGRGKRKSKGYVIGNFATDAIQTFAHTRKGQHRRRNSWSNGLRGRDDRFGDRRGVHRGDHFDGNMHGQGGVMRHNFVDERRERLGRNGRNSRRNAYSDDEEDGLPGLVSHAMQALMNTQKRTGRGRSGGMMSQIGGLVGRGDRRSRGPAEAVETALKVLGKLR